MALYCLVENGQIVEGPKRLPISWRNVSGLNLLDDAGLKIKGWLPYVDNPPEYNKDTQYLSYTDTVESDRVTKTYVVNDYTTEEMADRLQTAKTTRKKVIREKARSIIESRYPEWMQRNAALGIYDLEVSNAIKTYIMDIITESNRCEGLIDVAKTRADVEMICLSWPKVE